MMHESTKEATKHFIRMEIYQKKIKEKAQQDEFKRKQKTDHVVDFLNKHSDEFEKLKKELG